MNIYVACIKELKILASDAGQRLAPDNVLLFFIGQEEADPDSMAVLKNAFARVEVYDCPLDEYSLMLDVMRGKAGKDDTLYLIGSSLFNLYNKEKSALLDIFPRIYLSKTLNVEAKKPITRRSKRREKSKAEPSGEGQDTKPCPTPMDALTEMVGSVRAEKETQVPLDADGKAAGVSPAGKRTGKPEIRKKKTAHVSKEQKRQKRAFESVSMETAYEAQFSATDDAKGVLCGTMLERFLQHIKALLYPKEECPVKQKDVVPFVILLLRSYAKALEHGKKEAGKQAEASELDYKKIRQETAELFEDSWSSLHFIITMPEDALKLLLPESQYYWRLTKMLYEEDLWENIDL